MVRSVAASCLLRAERRECESRQAAWAAARSPKLKIYQPIPYHTMLKMMQPNLSELRKNRRKKQLGAAIPCTTKVKGMGGRSLVTAFEDNYG